jgi:hypothetical protein
MKNSTIKRIKILLEKFVVSEQPRWEQKLVLIYVKGKDSSHR